MKGRMVLTIGVALVISLGIPLLAFQGSDPLTGTWKGDWGPSASDRNPATLELKWDGKTLTGTVNPGPEGIRSRKSLVRSQDHDREVRSRLQGEKPTLHCGRKGGQGHDDRKLEPFRSERRFQADKTAQGLKTKPTTKIQSGLCPTTKYSPRIPRISRNLNWLCEFV